MASKRCSKCAHILLPLPFLPIPLIQSAKLSRPVLHTVQSTARIGRRGTLSNHSVLMSLLKDRQIPVLSLRRLLRSLLMYDPKRARDPQYALSLHPNHVRKPSASTSTTTSSCRACGLPARRSMKADTGLSYCFRQQGEDDISTRFRVALGELWASQLSKQSCELLRMRIANNLSPTAVTTFDSAPRLYFTNSEVRETNFEKLYICLLSWFL
jgi:hypothetical protein